MYYYYDFIQGPVHFFNLDSDRDEPDGISADSVQARWLKWSAVNGALKYQLELDNSADFSSLNFSATTHKLTLQTKTLLGSRTYYWRVRALDSAGNWSEWSNVFVITTR